MRRLVCQLVFLSVLGTLSCGPQPRVVISTQNGGQVAFDVEIADTPAERELGLQYRDHLAESRGMLFLFPEERENAFWMKNTPIPLDMIFINREGKIVGIVRQTAPFSLESRSVPAPSQFVLEINGGLSRRYGIAAGDSVRFEHISPEGVRE